MPGKQQITLNDIAAQSGVAVSTVSAALSGTGRVGRETQARILEIAARMNYRPNVAAQLLKRNRRRDIGLIVSNKGREFGQSDFFLPVLSAYMNLCNDRGIRCQTEFHDYEAKADMLPSLFTNGLAGGLLFSGHLPSAVRAFVDSSPQLPVVAIEEEAPYAVVSDVYAGVRNTLGRLAARGVRRVGLFTGPHKFRLQKEAFDGFEAAAAEFGLDTNEGRWIIPFEYMPGRLAVDFAVEAGKRLLCAPHRPEALLIPDGRLCRGVIHAASLCKVDIPRELAVIALFSDAEAESSWPALTTISRNVGQTVREAYALLEQRMAGTFPEHPRLVIPVRLVERETTCGLAAK
ncbi:MAG: LacI family DNA-binding transcriptional regulator [Lentisphaeria bacterium]|nr:LacI family DNA-binding transcriptional regulator [Lentisphaeria bacterium]